MIGEVHPVDQSFRILQKTGEDFRRIGRPEAIHFQPMATPWENRSQKEYDERAL